MNAPITEENIFQLTFILKELYNQREICRDKNVHFLKSLMSIMIMELDAFVHGIHADRIVFFINLSRRF